MRDAFVEALVDVARADPRVVLVTADLGFGVLDPFARAYPERFVNVGVAEQNMTGVAAGLAAEGHVVFTYSIGNFATMRCLEQIRNDVCYHDLDVKIVAVGGGFSYGALGVTHHATEDLAIMRALPNMTVIAPNDAAEARELTRAVVTTPGPAYLRIARTGPADLAPDIRPELARVRVLASGDDCVIFCTAGLAEEAIKALNAINDFPIDATVVSVHTLNPLDSDFILSLVRRIPRVISAEEHSIVGGLSSLLADMFLRAGLPLEFFQSCALPPHFADVVGSQTFLRRHYGLDAKSISCRLRTLLPFQSRCTPPTA